MFSRPHRSTHRLIATTYSVAFLSALTACAPAGQDILPPAGRHHDTSASAYPRFLGQFIDEQIMSVPNTARNYHEARLNADAVDDGLLQVAEIEPEDAPAIRVGIANCMTRESVARHFAHGNPVAAALNHEACGKRLAVTLRPKTLTE